eukprot:403357031
MLHHSMILKLHLMEIREFEDVQSPDQVKSPSSNRNLLNKPVAHQDITTLNASQQSGIKITGSRGAIINSRESNRSKSGAIKNSSNSDLMISSIKNLSQIQKEGDIHMLNDRDQNPSNGSKMTQLINGTKRRVLNTSEKLQRKNRNKVTLQSLAKYKLMILNLESNQQQDVSLISDYQNATAKHSKIYTNNYASNFLNGQEKLNFTIRNSSANKFGFGQFPLRKTFTQGITSSPNSKSLSKGQLPMNLGNYNEFSINQQNYSQYNQSRLIGAQVINQKSLVHHLKQDDSSSIPQNNQSLMLIQDFNNQVIQRNLIHNFNSSTVDYKPVVQLIDNTEIIKLDVINEQNQAIDLKNQISGQISPRQSVQQLHNRFFALRRQKILKQQNQNKSLNIPSISKNKFLSQDIKDDYFNATSILPPPKTASNISKNRFRLRSNVNFQDTDFNQTQLMLMNEPHQEFDKQQVDPLDINKRQRLQSTIDTLETQLVSLQNQNVVDGTDSKLHIQSKSKLMKLAKVDIMMLQGLNYDKNTNKQQQQVGSAIQKGSIRVNKGKSQQRQRQIQQFNEGQNLSSNQDNFSYGPVTDQHNYQSLSPSRLQTFRKVSQANQKQKDLSHLYYLTDNTTSSLLPYKLSKPNTSRKMDFTTMKEIFENSGMSYKNGRAGVKTPLNYNQQQMSSAYSSQYSQNLKQSFNYSQLGIRNTTVKQKPLMNNDYMKMFQYGEDANKSIDYGNPLNTVLTEQSQERTYNHRDHQHHDMIAVPHPLDRIRESEMQSQLERMSQEKSSEQINIQLN